MSSTKDSDSLLTVSNSNTHRDQASTHTGYPFWTPDTPSPRRGPTNRSRTEHPTLAGALALIDSGLPTPICMRLSIASRLAQHADTRYLTGRSINGTMHDAVRKMRRRAQSLWLAHWRRRLPSHRDPLRCSRATHGRGLSFPRHLRWLHPARGAHALFSVYDVDVPSSSASACFRAGSALAVSLLAIFAMA